MSANKFDLSKKPTFHMPHLESEHKLQKLLNLSLDAMTVSKKNVNSEPYLWGAEHYKIHTTSIWKKLDQQQKQNVLTLLSQRNLATSWWIESSGRNYGAKMVMLAESDEEKSLYSLFCAEETLHMREFDNFINFELDWNLHAHPMLQSLGEVIETGHRETLLVVVQVLLEGFGMAQYQALRDHSLNPELASAYERILKDEARHHGAGVILSQDIKGTPKHMDEMFEFCRKFINAFMDVSWVQDALSREAGPLSKSDLTLLHQELGTEQSQMARRKRFKDMLIKVDSFGLVKKLENDKVFL